MTRGKHIWLVPLLLAVLVGGVGWWADRELRRAVQQELRDDLESILDANVTALEIWMENQKRLAASLADEPGLKAGALRLLEQSSSGFTNRVAPGEFSRELFANERLQERVRSLGYGMVQLVSTNFTVVSDVGRRRSRQGNKVLEELQPKYSELFTNGEAIVITPFKVRPPEFPRRPGNRPGNQPRPPAEAFRPPGETNNAAARGWRPPPRDFTVMQVAAPIKDNEGHTRGALALIIDPDAEFTRILSVASPGHSGETLAFDGEGVLISKSRFDEELKRLKLLSDETNAVSALTLSLRDPGGDLTQGYVMNTNATHPLMPMVERAIEGEPGVELSPFRDYRGVPVVGAWRWLPKYGFGVGTKIDAREAFEPLRVVRRVFLILFLLLVFASLIILLFSIVQATWRRRLTEAELKARQLGQYKLSEKIGAGGMGVVYKAQHALLRRETAIKLLLPDKANADAIDRFEQEVRLTCRLTHPNTIQVFDYGHTPDGIFYYAMEYLDGLNLHDLVYRYGAQPEERVAYILIQICESLAEAHGVGLIHRDIKPANVFLCDRGGVPDSVKVLDFGLVKRVSEAADTPRVVEVAGEHGIVGTPNFIAPEAIKDCNQSDVRSDLYSLGALGYFVLTGREVFEGDSINELCRKHLTETPVPPGARIGKPFNALLESLIMRCLEKDPARRPQSARELAQALAQSHAAEAWTPEERARWWAEYRQRAAEDTKPAVQLDSSLVDKTVKIEFADRTP
ncbi:MAG TPA: serine/threonine protein kinase [Verrucomicrobiae bacterium]|nr:serine/threonine protein kinase [Verrucomicrobiae bacterium]